MEVTAAEKTAREDEVRDRLRSMGHGRGLEVRTLTNLLDRVEVKMPTCSLGRDDLQALLDAGMRILDFNLSDQYVLQFDSAHTRKAAANAKQTTT